MADQNLDFELPNLPQAPADFPAQDEGQSLAELPGCSALGARNQNSTWRRVHWLTPLLQVWQALVIILVVVLTQSLNNLIMLVKSLRENLPGHPILLLLVVAVPLAILVLLIVYLYFAWRATSWKISSRDFL